MSKNDCTTSADHDQMIKLWLAVCPYVAGTEHFQEAARLFPSALQQASYCFL